MTAWTVRATPGHGPGPVAACLSGGHSDPGSKAARDRLLLGVPLASQINSDDNWLSDGHWRSLEFLFPWIL